MAHTQRPSIAGRSIEVSVDRTAIREVLARLANPELKNDWCIACGAGKSAAPLGDTRQLTELTKEVMQGKSLQEFVDGLQDLGKRAWCIACGAGKDASPLDLVGDPAMLSDEVIDYVAANLLSAIRVG